MARRKKSKEGHDKQDIEDRKKKKKPAPEPKKKPGSATDQIKETATQGECPVITMSPTAAQMSVPPDASAEDPSVWSTGPGEAVMYHYSRQGQYAEEFASQQAEQSAVPAGVQVMGPGQ